MRKMINQDPDTMIGMLIHHIQKCSASFGQQQNSRWIIGSNKFKTSIPIIPEKCIFDF
jgi:hypothetical protein